MSRPSDPIQLQTTKSKKNTGKRSKTNIDKDYMEDQYDIEISNFDVNLGEFKEAEERFLEAISRKQLRDSDAIIKKATFFEENVIKLSLESDSFLVTTSDPGNDVENSSNQHDSQGFDVPK